MALRVMPWGERIEGRYVSRRVSSPEGDTMDTLVDPVSLARAKLARLPWCETHLRIDTIEPWTIRLDGRRV